MKYMLKSNKDDPQFKFLVRNPKCTKYWIFNDLEKALDTLRIESLKETGFFFIVEPCFVPLHQDWRSFYSYMGCNGVVDFIEEKRILLHIEHYVDAGEWQNPEEEL